MCYRDWANKATWVKTKLGPTAATLEAMLGTDKFFCGGNKPTIADFVICKRAAPAALPISARPSTKRVRVCTGGWSSYPLISTAHRANFYFYCLSDEDLDKSRIIAPSCLKTFPGLTAFVKRFEALPAIATYLASDQYMQRPLNNPHAQFK